MRCSVIKKRDGELCVGPEETLNRWRDHFEGILNVISSYEQAALDDVRQLPIRSKLLIRMRFWGPLADLL